MEKEYAMLKEWAVNYIKNKDVMTRAIESLEENKSGWDILAKTKTGDRYYLVIPKIKDFNEILQKIGELSLTIFVLNTRENLNIMIENWESLKKQPKLCIIFVNPDSELEKKWVLFPFTHDRITENASLKRGLVSLFQTVDSWKK